MYDTNDSVVSWMIAGGARYDEPDPRHLAHLVALRDAKRDAGPSVSPLAWLAARLGVRSSEPTPISSTTSCCAPA